MLPRLPNKVIWMLMPPPGRRMKVFLLLISWTRLPRGPWAWSLGWAAALGPGLVLPCVTSLHPKQLFYRPHKLSGAADLAKQEYHWTGFVCFGLYLARLCSFWEGKWAQEGPGGV